ncbi:MAG: Nif3-like dinuclear metal center hexameric protein [Clostridiales bacterium]|nr:Nif3-like dinuclear metal center hexameric protein [Clostridiales bacterium]
MKVSEVGSFLNGIFPPENALDYDNVGLIAGDGDTEVTGIVVSLDLTSKAIRTAKEKGANLIITHHPIIFGGITNLTTGDYVGKTLIELIKNGMSVISCHTNLDLTDEFGDLAIAEKLGVEDAKPLEGAVCGVVFDLNLSDFITLKEYRAVVAKRLGTSGIITINDPENKVNRVFVQGGAFDEDSIDAVVKAGVDTVVSGEIKHHICVALDEMGINTIIAGHSATEQAYLPKMAKLLSDKYAGFDITVNYNNEVSSIL